MKTIGERAIVTRRDLREALEVKHPTLFPRLLPPAPFDRTAIVAGRNQAEAPVLLSERARREHCHVIGTTGGGKSKFIESCVRQDVAAGRGVCVVDPHGDHPDSLYRSILAWLDERGYTKTRKIHLIDPNAPTHTTGFNPLACPDSDTDLSVIAGVTLEAFSRAWGGEDTTQKPTIERILTATFTALAALKLTLAEAPLLYDRSDRHGIRAWAIQHLTDRYAREELERLHELSLDERRRHDFDIEVIGPINRIARFVRPPAIRTMIGQTENVLDIRQALDEGHIILVNLSGGSRVYERDADLLGRLLTRSLFFHAKRRRAPDRTFVVYLDECHRYLSGDLEHLLAESRKYGVALVLAHQWLEQATTESENMLAALRNATNVKVVFRIELVGGAAKTATHYLLAEQLAGESTQTHNMSDGLRVPSLRKHPH
jgi:DNA helicase HerA-like ATPase